MKGFIINADDYGMALPVNDAIEKLSKLGSISSTSIMTNMPHVDLITRLFHDVPDIGVGVHLTITKGTPVSPIHEVSTLVNEEGEFFSYPQLIRKLLKGRLSLKQCKLELSRQINRAKELTNDRIDHWDSHEGIHRLEPLMSIFLKICLEMGIPAMRTHKHYWISSNSQSRFFSANNPGGSLKSKLCETYYLWLRWRSSRHFVSPKGLLVLDGFDHVREIMSIKSKREDVFEVVCHPATNTSGIVHTDPTDPVEKRVEEYEVLSKPENVDFLLKSKETKRLITFRDLLT